MANSLDTLAAFWQQQSELFGDAALLGIPRGTASFAEQQQNVLPVVTSELARETAPEAEQPVVAAKSRKKTLADVAAEAGVCTACDLSQARTKVVFGHGSEKPRILFVGEAPDKDDDASGLPFTGQVGALFDRMLTRMGFARGEVYITFPVKCKPPANRQPAADELSACHSFLQQQISLLQPRYIFCLGRVAAASVLNTSADIDTLRSSEHQYKGIRVFVTHNPAALLHNQGLFWAVFEDMKRFRAVYDREIGDKPPMPDAAKPGKNG